MGKLKNLIGAKILGHFASDNFFPAALITLVENSSKETFIIYPSLKEVIPTEIKPNSFQSIDGFIKPKNNETVLEDSYGYAISESEYFYGSHEEVCEFLQGRKNDGELPGDVVGVIESFLDNTKQ